MKTRMPLAERSGISVVENPDSCLPNAGRMALLAAEKELTLRKYSQRTIKSYLNHLGLFFVFFPEKKPETIQNEEIGTYLLHQIAEKH